MLKLIHCITDEKFTRTIINEFDFLKERCENRYVHITNPKKKKYKYLSDITQVIKIERASFLELLNKEECDIVILHNLKALPYGLIAKIPHHIRVVWFALGVDIYGKIMNKPFVYIPNMYHKETRKLLQPTFKERIHRFKEWIRRSYLKKDIIKAVNRIDFFSGIIPEEYDMMKHVSFFRAKPVEFRYASPYRGIEMSLLDEDPPKLGNDILIGNSGDPRNNHADVFAILKNIDLRNRKVIVPLSYGGSKRYREQIKSIGKEIWGDNFVAIENFMPLQDYEKLILSCGFRIFGQERQQAMGNINIALRTGCKVFIYKTSIIYKHFAKRKIKLHSIEDELDSEGLKCLPSEEEAYNNRRRIIERSLSSKQCKRLHKLIDCFEEEISKGK